MKKLFLLTCSLLTLLSCTTDKSNLETKNETFSSLEKKGDSLVTNERNCASQDILEYELKKNPQLSIKIEEIEKVFEEIKTNLDMRV